MDPFPYPPEKHASLIVHRNRTIAHSLRLQVLIAAPALPSLDLLSSAAQLSCLPASCCRCFLSELRNPPAPLEPRAPANGGRRPSPSVTSSCLLRLVSLSLFPLASCVSFTTLSYRRLFMPLNDSSHTLSSASFPVSPQLLSRARNQMLTFNQVLVLCNA